MKNTLFFLSLLLLCGQLFSQTFVEATHAPSSFLSFSFALDEDGSPFYFILNEEDTIVKPSRLGLNFKNNTLQNGFVLLQHTQMQMADTLLLPWGANKSVQYHCTECCYNLLHRGSGARMDIVVRVFPQTVAFRYEFSDTAETLVLTDELTQIRVADKPTTWWSWADFNTYEKEYYKTPLDSASWAAFPLLMRRDDGLHIAVREAAILNYPDATLKQTSEGCFDVYLTPYKNEDKAYLNVPFCTPWRVITVTQDALSLLNNEDYLTLLPRPKANAHAGKPMTYIGIWWAYHLGTKTWTEGPEHGATTAEAKRYIDFAARHHIGGVLVEGWNRGWAHWGDSADFAYTLPASDYDLQEVAGYAKQKGVRLIMHHETGGDITGYETQLEEAFRLCLQLGIHDVKTGHAGQISTGENHHGQQVVQHFQKVIETAARYEIALDMHEPVNGSGLEVSYPNFMTREGVRGLEWEAWSKGNSPSHTTLLPFTRGLSGPMDYTPGIFDILYRNARNRRAWNCTEDDLAQTRVHSTIVHQLALMLTLYSPWVMAADVIDNYENHPLFSFMENLNTDYDESHVLQAEVGEYIVVARRSGKRWYIAATTNEESRDIAVPLNFLPDDFKGNAVVYADGTDADWQTNPLDYSIKKRKIKSTATLNLHLASGGGAVVVIDPID